jgi:hypothetical protein
VNAWIGNAIQPLGYDALHTHLAGVSKHNCALRVREMLIDAMPSLAKDACQRCLAHFNRLAAQVGPVQLQEMESVEESQPLVPAVAKQLEGSHAILVVNERTLRGFMASTISGYRGPVGNPCGAGSAREGNMARCPDTRYRE